jgi:hypothetical protein
MEGFMERMRGRGRDNKAPIANVNNEYTEDSGDDKYAKGKDDIEYTKGKDYDKYAGGNKNKEYTKGDYDNKPLDEEDDNKYIKEGNLVEGDGKDEPLAEGKDDNK